MQLKNKFSRLVIASYRLPFKINKTKYGYRSMQSSGGLVSAILALSEKFRIEHEFNDNKTLWIGVSDNYNETLNSNSVSNENFTLAFVNISQKLNDLYYGGFCNDLIWPLFHYFPTYCVYNTKYYEAYKEVNQKFCDELVKFIQPGDFIWVHDYQLMLLPEMLRQVKTNASIGFFLHIPFPSYEIFRLLPRKWREEIITGISGADLVGFHTHDYTQHFIKSVKRTVGFECQHNLIYSPHKVIKADAFPIGIDYNKFNNACESKLVIKEKNKIKRNLTGQKLIFSVDRLDYSKGLLYRLKGYETFLEQYPQWLEKVIFNMVVVPSRDNIEKYKEMKKEIEAYVGRLNGRYSTLTWRPVIYQYKSLSFNELIALYDMSDVGLITPLRDGMNLVAKEFVACQSENKGVLILSEMAGAAAELNEAIIINPVDNIEMADAIYEALEMKPSDKNIRLSRMQQRISNYDVFTWANDFFTQTFETKDQQALMSITINNNVVNEIINTYKSSQKRILFIDYDGTLVSFTKYPELATLDQNTSQIIKKIANDKRNEIVIISGRDKDFLEKQFGNIPVTLVAEHGFFIKKQNSNWESAIQTDSQWKSLVMPILNEYVNRCNGTFIEEKTGSLAWHFRNAESDFAQLRLLELRDDLAEVIRHKTDFEILEGNKVLEIKCGKYDKGKAAEKLLKDRTFDFILAAGDDKTDEFLFKSMPVEAFTIKIGLNPSFARYNMINHSQLLKLLERMTEE